MRDIGGVLLVQGPTAPLHERYQAQARETLGPEPFGTAFEAGLRMGLTNKQIANALVISQRTAEGPVEHVLTKLGFTSRAQIAAWVTEREAHPRDQRRR